MNKTKASYLEGIISVIVNSLLFFLKIWAGIITGSIALTADAWHTLSDSLSSIIVIIVTRLSSRKADKKHPFGYGRWEQIGALSIAFFLGIIAWGFLKDSINQFYNKEATIFGTLAIVVTVISIVVKEALAQYAFYIARKTNNLSIKADGWHHRTDALSSVVVLAGILLAGRFWWIDSVLGTIISMMLFYATWEIAREAVSKLLGEQPNQELIEEITQEVRPLYAGYLHLHHFHIHNYTSHQELTFHIKLDEHYTLQKVHHIVTAIENKILDKFGIIATVHAEPLNFAHASD